MFHLWMKRINFTEKHYRPQLNWQLCKSKLFHLETEMNNYLLYIVLSYSLDWFILLGQQTVTQHNFKRYAESRSTAIKCSYLFYKQKKMLSKHELACLIKAIHVINSGVGYNPVWPWFSVFHSTVQANT